MKNSILLFRFTFTYPIFNAFSLTHTYNINLYETLIRKSSSAVTAAAAIHCFRYFKQERGQEETKDFVFDIFL